MKAIVTFIVLIATASCFYITEPYSVTKWSAGNRVTIKWRNDNNNYDKIIVDLLNGPSENGIAVRNIGSLLPKEATSVDFIVPNDLPSGGNYFIRIVGTSSKSPIYSFSARFYILSDPSKSDDVFMKNPNNQIINGSADDVKTCPTCRKNDAPITFLSHATMLVPFLVLLLCY
jgi:hypothetical protein